MREDKKILTKHALQPGTVVAGAGRTYTIVRTLGTGGFGITYLADDDLGNRIVIKEFFLKGCWRGTDGITVEHAPTIDEDFETGRTDFVEEARRLGILGRNSPNIVTVYNTFEALGTAYYTMEYIDGGDLRSYVEEHGPMPEQQAVETILTVASAVGMLHASHVLHLDIKPGNIVLRHGSDGKLEPVLIDFGIAKHFGSDGSPTTYLTAKGASSGYAPIEQYDDIDTFSPQIDIYALGGTLYYLLTGKNPPKAFDIKSFDELRGNLPEGLGENTVAALEGAMKHIKHERLQTIDTFMSLLCGHTVYNNATEVIFDHRKNKHISKNNLTIVIISILVGIISGLVLMFQFESEDKEAPQEILVNNYENEDMQEERFLNTMGGIKICELKNGSDSLESYVVNFIMSNFINEFLYTRGKQLADTIDCVIASPTIQRTIWQEGDITVGDLYNMMPFENVIQVIAVEAEELANVRDNMIVENLFIDERLIYLDIDPDKTYHVVTIDYIATGGTYMEHFKNARLISKSHNTIQKDFEDFIYKKTQLNLMPNENNSIGNFSDYY